MSKASLPSNADVDSVDTHGSSDADQGSVPFVGRWNQLISTANWEKGKIICDWQKAMREAGNPASSYSDEAWSRLVGGVSPQHVGRLRRSWSRFGHVYQEYEGLYWSHFYAALDWDDAEMWLEGAVQSDWSVSQMRTKRWETLGKLPGDKPKPKDIVVGESEEETQSLALADRVSSRDREFIEGPIYEGPDFGDADQATDKPARTDEAMPVSQDLIRGKKLFEQFADLPNDVAKAANHFKLAILRHKAKKWEQVSLEDLLDLLDALKQLASDPSER